MANPKTVLGIFSDRSHAESALSQLTDMGLRAQDISIIVRDSVVESNANQGENTVVEGAVSGATTGGALGGIAGLLIGLGVIALPGIGGLFIGGPLAAALGLTGAAATTVTGATTGALAGGLIGGLVGLGVPQETAQLYEQRIREGAVLLAVPLSDNVTEDRVREVFTNQGAEQIRTV